MPDPSQDTKNESNTELVEQLCEKITCRLKNGESPTVEEYVEKYPDVAAELRAVFPALLIVNQVSPGSDETVDASSSFLAPSNQRLGDYQIIRKIGQGGMGLVFEANQVSLNRKVALKVLPEHFSSNQKFIERFRREARSAAKLHHTNIVPVFEVGQVEQTLFYAMQFIEGQGLDEIIRQTAKLDEQTDPSPSDTMSRLVGNDRSSLSSSSWGAYRLGYFKSIARIGAAVADALNYAHERSIVHRDVKPANLILDTNLVVWLADFGLAKTTDSELTETGDFLGTARYMSPERFKGIGDHRGDIYGLGITLYELVTRRRAFEFADRIQLLDQIANVDPEKPREIDSQIPLDLETIILKSMEKDQRRRYQNAAEMADDLRRFMDDQPIKARRATFTERSMRWMRKHKALTAAMISMAIAIASLIVGTVLTLQQRDLAFANETQAKEQKDRADRSAERARESAIVSIDALSGLVESVQIEMRNHPGLLTLKQKILSNAEQKLDRVAQLADNSPDAIVLKIRANIVMGKLNYEIGEYKSCQEYYDRAIKLVEELEDQQGFEDDVLRFSSDIYTGLGSMHFEKHDQENARKMYQLAFEIDELRASHAKDDLEVQCSYARSADNLADTYVLLNDRDWNRAEKYHKIAFEIRKHERSKRNRQYELEYDFAMSQMKLGDMDFGRSRNNEIDDKQALELTQSANRWFIEALQTAKSLVDLFPDDRIRSLRHVAAMHERIADTSSGNEAHQHYMKSINIKEELAPMLQLDRNFQRDLAISWGRAAIYLYQNNDVKNAREYLNKCLKIIRETLNRIPTDAGLRIDEMVTLYQIGAMNEGEQKRKAWESAVKIGDELVKQKTIPKDHPLYRQIKGKLDELNAD